MICNTCNLPLTHIKIQLRHEVFLKRCSAGLMSWKDTHFTYLSRNRENAQKLKERAESDSSSSLAVQFVWLNPVTDIFPSISQTTRRSCTFCNNCFYLGGRGRIWVRHQWKTAIRGNLTWDQAQFARFSYILSNVAIPAGM